MRSRSASSAISAAVGAREAEAALGAAADEVAAAASPGRPEPCTLIGSREKQPIAIAAAASQTSGIAPRQITLRRSIRARLLERSVIVVENNNFLDTF